MEKLKLRLEQQAGGPAAPLDLYVYSDVEPGGFDWWTGEEMESQTSQDFFRQELSKYPDAGNINLYINSAGGSVTEGYGIYAQLKRHPAYKTVYVDGFANSIASVIAMCGDRIVMLSNAVMGIHNMMDYCFGNAAEHRKCADDLDRLMEGNRQIYLNRSGGRISEEKLTELLDQETYLTAAECLEYGFCDEISDRQADPREMVQKLQRVNAGLAAQMKYHQALRQAMKEAREATESAIIAGKVPPPPEPPPPAPPERNLKSFFNRLAQPESEE